jgi:hypothetical protein
LQTNIHRRGREKVRQERQMEVMGERKREGEGERERDGIGRGTEEREAVSE